MIAARFLSKTNRNKGITTIPLIVVMLLLLSASCSKEAKEVVDVVFNPDSTYTMKVTEVTSLISDSGITRYSVKTKEWFMYGKAAEPYWYFPKGVYVEKFDTLFRVETNIKADTAYYYEKKGLWKLIGHVEVISLQGENFQTSLLFLDQKEDKAYSDQYIRIEQKDKVITGIGFESNLDMTKYKIFNSTGIFPIKDSPADSTQTATTTQNTPPATVPEGTRTASSKQDSIKGN